MKLILDLDDRPEGKHVKFEKEINSLEEFHETIDAFKKDAKRIVL